MLVRSNRNTPYCSRLTVLNQGGTAERVFVPDRMKAFFIFLIVIHALDAQPSKMGGLGRPLWPAAFGVLGKDRSERLFSG